MIRNIAYVHSFCVEDEIVFVNSDFKKVNNTDIFTIGECRYEKLYQYFYNCKNKMITITINKIENMLETKFNITGQNLKQQEISRCWIENGYQINDMDVENQTITFIKKISNLNIPTSLLSSNLPNSAKYELEQFFDYITKKYHL